MAFHLERLIEAGMDIDLRPMFPPAEKVEEIRRAAEDMVRFLPTGQRKGENLMPSVKNLLGDEYS